MKTQIQSLTFAAMLAGALILPRTSFAGGLDHAAMAAKYTKLAATQQAVIDDGLKLKAENKVISAKAASNSPAVVANQGYDAMIAAASKEKAELERYAKWHKLEAAGANNVDALITEQQGILDAAQKAKAEAAKAANAKTAPKSAVDALTAAEAKISAASAELADLQGFAAWHKVASTSASTEIAALVAEQQALVDEHSKMKAETRVGYKNEKLTPSSRYAEMDSHCDKLIDSAVKQLEVLKEFSKK